MMLLAITLHDADHIRQAANLCYTITATLWIINIAVYLPSLAALALSLRHHRFAPLATSTSALLIAFLFAKVHLWKPTFNAWGIWNKTFFALGADWISWSVLTLLVLVGVVVAMTGMGNGAEQCGAPDSLKWRRCAGSNAAIGPAGFSHLARNGVPR